MIYLILLLALVLRLVNINQSLWLDEAIGAIAARDYTYREIFTELMTRDNHTPLYYLLLKAWTNVFGFSELSIRMPSILFGIGTVYLTFKVAEEISKSNSWKLKIGKPILSLPKDWKFPEVAALMLATSGLHIYYSQEARMYSMAAFFASLAVYAYIRIIKEAKPHNKHWVIFSLSVAALVFTDYVPVFLLPVFWIYGIYKTKNKTWWKYLLLSHIPLVILSILWLPIILIQAESGKWLLATWPEWKAVAGGATFKQAALVWMKFIFGRISLHNKGLYYLIILISSVPFLISLISARITLCKNIVIWMWLIIPLLIGFGTSFFIPAFIYFRFLYILPAFYLLTAIGIYSIKNKSVGLLLILSIIAINLTGWFVYVIDGKQQREKWVQAVNFIENNAGGEDVILFSFTEPFAPFEWYYNGAAKAAGATDNISANPEKSVEITKELVQDAMYVFYFEYLSGISDPQKSVVGGIKESGFEKVNTYDFQGVGFVEQWKRSN
jgi:uncharacterized membrane protein